MPLLDLQRSLVGFARGSQHAYQQSNSLTNGEREWLNEVLNSRGLNVTQQIQQWWRIARICSSAPLTVEMLKRKNQIDLMINYIIQQPIRTLFFVAELEQFKNFVERDPTADDTTKSLIAFEAAIKATLKASSGVNHSGKDKFTTKVIFWRDPVKLFAALLTNTPLPEHEPAPYYVEINPKLESLWSCERSLRDKVIPTNPVTNISKEILNLSEGS